MTGEALVVDVGIGNLHSVRRALEVAGDRGVKVVRSNDPDRVRKAERVIVPGQGSFGTCARLLSGPLSEALGEVVKRGTPYLGICLGLQILFETSEESPGARGFGWFPGQVRHLEVDRGLKIPHMGWNQIDCAPGGNRHLERAGGTGTWFYFVHSFHAVPADPSLSVTTCRYGSAVVTAAVSRDNVLATQFHPEKSQAAGLALMRSFLQG